ncbi:PEP-CTERM sorting domain-containing protein [Luteolibacter flavescens]|uniref:PEP-CTERM sorting domain-containing protein n=1 Tax=Luteolibacter flavescens TaxID=1859460 RepID=A0ABT3FN35_9BACT|nr:PEP-CTERM sorting domain-containing protein [Luteolibacter flavescens]MCW1884872.1 PEP-CTERM sorting domain-containing protein [Luteolibacter flavescens]
MKTTKSTYCPGFVRFASAVAIACGTLAPASAALVLDPASGLELAFTPDLNEDAQVNGSQTISGSLFGFGYADMVPTISLNGYISLGSAPPLMDPMRLGESGGDRIAPLWFDFGVGATTKVIEHTGSGYYGITWQALTVPGQTDLVTFQAIIFSGAASIAGQSFLAGDIVFSYGDLSFYEFVPEVVIGLEDIAGSQAGLPTSDFPGTDLQGWHSHDVTGDIPVGADEFVRFRPDGSGNYGITLETIPEPSTSLLMAAGLACLWRRRR